MLTPVNISQNWFFLTYIMCDIKTFEVSFSLLFLGGGVLCIQWKPMGALWLPHFWLLLKSSPFFYILSWVQPTKQFHFPYRLPLYFFVLSVEIEPKLFGYQIVSKCLVCFTQKKRYVTIRGWVNDDRIVIFVWIVSFNILIFRQNKRCEA